MDGISKRFHVESDILFLPYLNKKIHDGILFVNTFKRQNHCRSQIKPRDKDPHGSHPKKVHDKSPPVNLYIILKIIRFQKAILHDRIDT